MRVPAERSRRHVHTLSERGMSYTEMANAANVARSTVVGLAHEGERKWATIRQPISERLCAIPIPETQLVRNVGAAAPRKPVESAEAERDEDETVSPETLLAARKVTAHYATGAEDLRMLLSMLGIGGDTTALCGRCGESIYRAKNEGYNRPGRDGKCGRCVDIEDKAAKRAAARS